VPDEEVAWLDHRLRKLALLPIFAISAKVDIAGVPRHLLVPLPVGAQKVLRRSDARTGRVHGGPEAQGIRVVYGTRLVVLVPSEALVWVHQKVVRGNSHLRGAPELREHMA